MSSPIRSVRKRRPGVWMKDEDLEYYRDWKKRIEEKYNSGPCPFCGVEVHPKLWTHRIIMNVHDYSFLKDCKDLEIPKSSFEFAPSNTVAVINVPMVDGHPWKTKAEQVIKYTDVELGIGDQSAFNEFHYRQPCDRMILLIILSGRVVGLLVAEKLSEANCILKETTHYQNVEENTVKVRVGINRMWIDVSMRRRGFATKLLTLVRYRFFKGEILQKSDFAFNSSLSNAGIGVAMRFLQTYRVPVYKGKTGIEN